MKLFESLHHSRLLNVFFPTTISLLQKELVNCHRVLDLGCGPSSPIQYCSNISSSLGIDNHIPYLQASKKKKIHHQYRQANIKNLDFPSNSFDAVILISVIEHLKKEDALKLLEKAEKWAIKKIILTTPNGYWPQDHADNNLYQEHLSEWNVNNLKHLKYRTFGLAGLKALRKPGENNSIDDNLYNSIRFQPRLFWFIVATISQVLTFKFPQLAFEIFAVKDRGNSK
jgi:SAM-dependent methyltransferase